MSKLKLALIAAAVTLTPVAAFAAHAHSCCGNWICCLRHLGCC